MTADDRLLSCTSSESPNKSSGDIGERSFTKPYRGDKPILERLLETPLPSLNRICQDRVDAAAEIERRDRLISAHQQQIIDGSAILAAKDAEIERLREEVEDSHARIKRLSDALLTVRPLGGSELFVRWGDKFHADPDYCKEQIDRLRTSYHEAMTTMVRERKRADTAESAVAAAWEEAAKIAENLRFAILPDQMSKWELAEAQRRSIASAIRAAGAEKTAESGHSPSTPNSESE